jgi:RHS repeat-associated protein
VQYTYDGAARLVLLDDGTQRWQYEYGYLDQLDRVLRDGQVVAEYEYDLCGRRTCKRVGDEETRFYYHINDLMTWTSSRDGRWDIAYVPETMAPLAMVHDGRQFFISFDQIGTPTEVWDEDEQLLAVIRSQAYGTDRDVEWLSGSPLPLPFHFQGQFCDDETGLHYNRFRYYWPAAARFITPDPIGFGGGLNFSIYPPNPINWIDPLGLACPSPIRLRCGTRKKQFSPCEAKAAVAKLNRMNKGKRRRCEKASKCRSGKQKQHYLKNCSGPAIKKGFDVDHSKEVQQGGSDLCCKNLMAIPARPNRSLGAQIRYRMRCAAAGELLPKFELGSPCTSPSHINKCKTDFKPGRKKPGATDSCKDVQDEKDCK